MATEETIIQNVFSLLEKDSDYWTSTAGSEDNEYITARAFLNMGVVRWENYDNTTWRELWTTLADAGSGQSTVSASTWTYDCPTDFVRPGGYVTTTDSAGTVTFWRVLPPEEQKKYSNTTDNFAYFTGNSSAGHSVNFNAKTTPSAAATIDYPYYKSATQSSATSTVLEVGDPNFLSYFIAAHMSESTDAIDSTFFTVAEGLLKQMKSVNNSGIWGTPFNIEPSLEDYIGFGYGNLGGVSSGNPTGR